MITADTYSEVYEILSYMDKSTVMKIPIEILNNIKNRRNINYISSIDPTDLFNLNNIKKETIDVLISLDINFWMNDLKKSMLKKEYYKETMEKQKELRQKYSSEKMFENNNKEFRKDSARNLSNIIKYKEPLFKRIKKYIKCIFRKNNE